RIAHDELGREDPRALYLAIEVARHQASGSPGEAAAQLEEVIAVAEAHDEPDSAALARFELARLRSAEAPAQARALAEAAQRYWRERGPGRTVVAPFAQSAQERAADIEAWLAAQQTVGAPPAGPTDR
ncbi:MAG: hypothetical protein KDK70_41720, partial [Myxococcales bacterium]|nr:hypothetical protein [Myxococcales bacterium]